jgi:hypothetical protein
MQPKLGRCGGAVHAVFPSRRGMVPAVRSLLDALSEGFAVAECQDARRAAQTAPTDSFRRGAVPDPTLQAPS